MQHQACNYEVEHMKKFNPTQGTGVLRIMIKNILTSAAAIGLAVSPVAAQAGTRAAASLPTLEAGSISIGERTTASVKKSESLQGSGIIIGVIALAAVIAGIIVAADDDDDDRTD